MFSGALFKLPPKSSQQSKAGKLRGILGWASLVLLTPTLLGAQAEAITLDDVFASPNMFGTPPSAPKWAPDSQHFAFSWNDEGLPERGLWLASADGEELEELQLPEASDALSDFIWHGDSQALLVVLGSELWQLSISDRSSQRLGVLGKGASNLGLAPDGSKVAFLKEGDLWIFDLESKTSQALSNVGIAGLSALSIGRYNRPEREIGPGIWGGPTYAWSPDSGTIAVHLVDRRHLPKVPFPDYLSPETSPNEIRRAYPGDANESRQVGLINVSSGKMQLLPLESPKARQVIGFSWSVDGVLLVDIASDTAEDRWLYRVDDMQLETIWHSHRESRIYTGFASAWDADGQNIVFLSDLDDRYGLYRINALSMEESSKEALEDASEESLGESLEKSPRLLSDPRMDVLSAPQITASGQIIYAANAPSAAESQVFRVGPDDGTPERLTQPTQITQLPGYNTPYPSPDGKHLAFLHSEAARPPELYSVATAGGDAQRVTHSQGAAFSEQTWARTRYVSFPSLIDDYTLHARILEPPVLEPGKQYPVLFGPMYSNTVRNRWSGRYSRIQQLLVQKGYIVVQVDMRGSTGYGRDFREEFLVDFAGDDIEDIVSTVEYLKSEAHMDTDRMGIWGSSYGGTLSIYTLLKKPGLFRAGVAAAAAVDPHFFGTDDVAIVRRPDTHPGIFLNSAARYAKNLEDHLLIIHGMQDQVVPFKTTAALADVLIREGKDFDFAFAPGATHSWSREAHYSRYLFGKMLQHFDRYLQPREGMPQRGKNQR
ncbi:S9 family peptidase [Congregibacter litoralis]|uniref:Dipeptidyl aminopeptidases/acylaminoacyl-peptidase n=1 Tax=Congregibacter litoralis KT71 TaxID=314285 RepID=A4A758_9GAMM|nr:prolyl oligopeptidase family serine peptidase [Congregibacter litoralis]EAQ98127.1 Dipeptidyl aminopeptidases/acylaminoacyl-peptidase [Congregibacter litoralis KT71]